MQALSIGLQINVVSLVCIVNFEFAINCCLIGASILILFLFDFVLSSSVSS